MSDDEIDLGRDFRMGKLVCLRSAGFSCGDVLQLASPRTSAAVDALLQLEAELNELRGAVLARCSAERKATTGAVRASWFAAMDRVQRRRLGGLSEPACAEEQ